MNYIKYTALIIVILVLLMPVSYASILTGTAFGKDLIVETARASDDITLRARITGSTPAKEQISYTTSTSVQKFQECSGEYCTLKLNSQKFDSRSYSFPIKYQTDYETQYYTIKLYPDVLGAKINSVSASRTRGSPSNTLTFTVNFQDDACSSIDCGGKCSGVKNKNLPGGKQTKCRRNNSIFNRMHRNSRRNIFVI